MVRHASQLNLADAPKAGSPAFEDWAETWTEAFARINTFWDEAEKAARRVRQVPTSQSGWWWKDQLPSIVAAIQADRSDNPARVEIPAQMTREQAEWASRDCRNCTGSGWAEVFHRLYDGKPTIEVVNSDGSVSRIAARFRLACNCAYGRWLLDANKRSASNSKLSGHESEQQRKFAAQIGWIDAVTSGRAADYSLKEPRREAPSEAEMEAVEA